MMEFSSSKMNLASLREFALQIEHQMKIKEFSAMSDSSRGQLMEFSTGNATIAVSSADLLAKVRSGPDSVVAVCGSLAAGFGTSQSDFDLFCFCNERPVIDKKVLEAHSWVANKSGFVNKLLYSAAEPLKETYDYWGDDGLAIGINYSEFEEVEATMSDYHNQYVEMTTNLGYVRDFSKCQYGIGDKTMLSKLHTGICILNVERFRNILSICPIEEYCYVAFRRHITYHEDIKDLVGAWRSGNMYSAYCFAKLYAEWAAFGASHLMLDPNTNRKWLPTMVSRWPNAYATLSKRYREILCSPRSTDKDLAHGVVELLDWSDSVFRVCSELLLSNPKFPDPSLSLQYLRDNLGKAKTEYQMREEFEWYRRIYDADFVPSKDFLDGRIEK